MKISFECDCILLGESLRLFLRDFISPKKDCDFIVADKKIEAKKPVFVIAEHSPHLKIPFSKEVKEATEKLNKQMEDLGTSIRFGYNDKIGAMYVNVMEMKTGEVIRKIPTEQAMKLSEYFKEAVGVLFDKES